MKLSRSIFAAIKRPSKKVMIWASVVAVLVVIGAYALWSQRTWAQYQPSYAQWRQDIYTEVATAAALPTTTDDERRAAITRYADIVRHIDDQRQSICQVPTAIEWQATMLDSLAAAQADCRNMTTTLDQFKTQLQAVTAYLQDDQAFAAIIAKVPQPDELASDKWAQQVAAWDKAIQSTKELSVSDAFEPTKTLAIKRMAAIKTAWQDVIAAHKAKDETQYVAAQSTLVDAYDGIYNVVTASEKTASGLIAELQKLSVAAFKNGKH